MPGVIKINPAVFNDRRAAFAVALNEALRLWMEDNQYTPVTKPTDEQLDRLADTAYADDPEAMAKTVLARVATLDESAPNPSPEQIEEALALLDAAAGGIPPDSVELPTLDKLMDTLAALLEPADMPDPEEEVQPEMPPEMAGEMPPEMAEEMPAEMPAEPQEGLEMPQEDQGIPEEAPLPDQQDEALPDGNPEAEVPIAV